VPWLEEHTDAATEELDRGTTVWQLLTTAPGAWVLAITRMGRAADTRRGTLGTRHDSVAQGLELCSGCAKGQRAMSLRWIAVDGDPEILLGGADRA